MSLSGLAAHWITVKETGAAHAQPFVNFLKRNLPRLFFLFFLCDVHLSNDRLEVLYNESVEWLNKMPISDNIDA